MIAENGLAGTYSGTKPNFYRGLLTDQYRPTDKWLFNVGVRLDSYGFVGQNTLVPPLGGSAAARAFWFNAYNLDNCVNNQTGAPDRKSESRSDRARPVRTRRTCRTLPRRRSPINIWQPRISGTYTSNPNDVFRFSYGRYTEAPNTAFEQYNTRQEDLADYIGSHFLAVRPQHARLSDSAADLDQLRPLVGAPLQGHGLSFKLTPFLRQTQDQIQQFYLNPQPGFVSGLNVGSQRSEGVEFQMQKGDFSRDGISGLLSFAYTNSYIHYGPIAAGASGSTVLAPINNSIAQYNAYTKYLRARIRAPIRTRMCGGATTNGSTANACYNKKRSAGGCRCREAAVRSGDIANPVLGRAPASAGQYRRRTSRPSIPSPARSA